MIKSQRRRTVYQIGVRDDLKIRTRLLWIRRWDEQHLPNSDEIGVDQIIRLHDRSPRHTEFPGNHVKRIARLDNIPLILRAHCRRIAKRVRRGRACKDHSGYRRRINLSRLLDLFGILFNTHRHRLNQPDPRLDKLAVGHRILRPSAANDEKNQQPHSNHVATRNHPPFHGFSSASNQGQIIA